MLAETVKLTLKDATQKLTGSRKRAFMAKVAQGYFGGSARKVETLLRWKVNRFVIAVPGRTGHIEPI